MLVNLPPEGAWDANAVPKEGDEPRLRIWNPPTNPPSGLGRLSPITALLFMASIATPQLVQPPPLKPMLPVPALDNGLGGMVREKAVPVSRYTWLLFAVHTVW